MEKILCKNFNKKKLNEIPKWKFIDGECVTVKTNLKKKELFCGLRSYSVNRTFLMLKNKIFGYNKNFNFVYDVQLHHNW